MRVTLGHRSITTSRRFPGHYYLISPTTLVNHELKKLDFVCVCVHVCLPILLRYSNRRSTKTMCLFYTVTTPPCYLNEWRTSITMIPLQPTRRKGGGARGLFAFVKILQESIPNHSFPLTSETQLQSHS